MGEFLFKLGYLLKRFHDRVGIERYTLYTLAHEEFGEVGEVRRSLPADAEIFPAPPAGADNFADEGAHGLVIFICNMCHDARIAVQPESELSEVVGADGHAVKEIKKFFIKDDV